VRKRRWRVTKVGWVIIAILVACAVLLTVTSGGVRFLAGVVGGVILLALFGQGMSGLFASPYQEAERKAEVLREERFGKLDDS
jgi:hypothetical protein